jgi:hypothetical protein
VAFLAFSMSLFANSHDIFLVVHEQRATANNQSFHRSISPPLKYFGFATVEVWLSINAVLSALFSRIFSFHSSHFAIILKSCRSATQDLFFSLWKAFPQNVAATEMILQSNHVRSSFPWMIFRSVMTISVFSFESFSLWWQLSIQRFCARSPVFLNMFERYPHDKNNISNTVL